jgi:tRNA pseudouridine65 synthase
MTKVNTAVEQGNHQQDALVPVKPILTILYQDEYIVAIDKPPGLFVHRSYMDRDAPFFALQLLRDQIGQYVYPVHRLDRPTSGVLLFALTKDVARLLSEMFENKLGEGHELKKSAISDESQSAPAMLKTYYALTRGYLADPSGVIDYPLKEKLDKLGDKYVSANKPAKSALTHYQVEQQGSLAIKLGKFDSVRYSLVKLQPITGRRHQIRRHLAHLRHPIIGDINYGDNKQNPFFSQYFGFKRLMLMAKSLEFNHPISDERLNISATFDEQWQQFFSKISWPVLPQ